MDRHHFRDLVIKPTLARLGAKFATDAAVNLLIGTALHESGGLRWLRQLAGPAQGIYQVEPATLRDVFANYLRYRPVLRARVALFAAPGRREPQLVTNLAYATVIARIIYWRAPEPLPDADDIDGLGKYWKRVYNSKAGKGEAEDFAAAFRRHHVMG